MQTLAGEIQTNPDFTNQYPVVARVISAASETLSLEETDVAILVLMATHPNQYSNSTQAREFLLEKFIRPGPELLTKRALRDPNFASDLSRLEIRKDWNFTQLSPEAETIFKRTNEIMDEKASVPNE